jgi:hypothetical protein
VAPSVATHNTITDHTTKVKFQVMEIGLSERALSKGIASKDSHKLWNQQGGGPKINTQHKRT